MPYGDANAIMLEMANETLTVVKDTPVLAGICGTDPFRDMTRLLREVKELGFTGVQNFPTVGLIDGVFRQNLEETGMDYGKEVEMIRLAHEMDLLTTPYVFNVKEAERMTDAGADIVVAHMGLTTSGTIGAQTALALDDCVKRVRDITNAAKRINPNVIVLCHGGPIATPEQARYVIERVKGVHGFCECTTLRRRETTLTNDESWGEFAGKAADGGRDKASDGGVQVDSVVVNLVETTIQNTSSELEAAKRRRCQNHHGPPFRPSERRTVRARHDPYPDAHSSISGTSPCSSTFTPITLLEHIMHSRRTRA